ncbi:MAG: DUF2461 domain-containing protein [Bacteroidales bacterium]|nr:DUF2461 domain-containing protein [Bacteroidales bacterium]
MDALRIFDFLNQLKDNNNREWFQENKSEYELIRKDFIDFIRRLIEKISKFDKEIIFLSPLKCIFRINRDIRFSNNKSPYKINFGGLISKGGRNAGNPGYYFHIEPGNSFISGGIYMPRPEALKALREDIYYNPDEFKKIINDDLFLKNFKEIQGRKLKRNPRGFPPEFSDINLLKYKDYYVTHTISDQKICSEDIIDYAVEIYKAMLPLNHYILQAVSYPLA